jgi:hippurate hydrolase
MTTTTLSTLLDDSRELQPDLRKIRRDLHRIPEVGLSLPRTQDAVLSELDTLGLEVSTGNALSSVTAVLRGGRPGDRTVLLRGDMDALPVVEETGLEFAAEADRMHACGHDLHATMLLGAAKMLAPRRDQLGGDVVFMFQPGEEGYDGAGRMLDEGVLTASGRAPDAAYALHVMSSGYDSGVFTGKGGPMLAASNELHVTVRGRGGHGSAPFHAVDPMPIACEMVLALQSFITRSFDVFDPVVLTVGMISGGTAANIIPDDVRFTATVRTFSAHAQGVAKDGAIRVCRGVAAAHGADVDAEFVEQYPVTVNDQNESVFAATTLRELHGEHRFVPKENPISGSEDFSRVLDEVPGAMVMLGACPPELDPGSAPYNHSPRAQFDDAVLSDGAAAYAALAVERLRAEGAVVH